VLARPFSLRPAHQALLAARAVLAGSLKVESTAFRSKWTTSGEVGTQALPGHLQSSVADNFPLVAKVALEHDRISLEHLVNSRDPDRHQKERRGSSGFLSRLALASGHRGEK
jgi:hypothetical protein